MDGSQELMVFQALGRIEEALAELRGPKGRIAVLEDDADKITPLVEKHERIVVAASFLGVPILAALHGVLKKIGW
jgi:hypothetical protein